MSARDDYPDLVDEADGLTEPNDFVSALDEIDELREANQRLRDQLTYNLDQARSSRR